MVIVSHPNGNQNVRALLSALIAQGLLTQFITSFAWNEGSILGPFLPSAVKTTLEKRAFQGVPLSRISQDPFGEALRVAILRLPRRLRIGLLGEYASVPNFLVRHDASAAERIGRVEGAEAVWCFTGSCLKTIKAAKAKGMKVYLELPSAYWRFYSELFAEEAMKCPEWAATIDEQEESRLFSRIDEEISLADHLVVPSSFPLMTLKKYSLPECPVSIINYGGPPALKSREWTREPTDRIRALYVGGLTQQKGIGYLFEAAARSRSVASLTVVGGIRGMECEALNRALGEHRWIPSLPHADVLSIMREHDVLIHPSLSEGSALVIGEALSQGLVPIVTPNCGVEHLVKDGINGYVVPIRNAEIIANKLSYLNGAKDMLSVMGANALISARENSWAAYQLKIAKLLKKTLNDVEK